VDLLLFHVPPSKYAYYQIVIWSCIPFFVLSVSYVYIWDAFVRSYLVSKYLMLDFFFPLLVSKRDVSEDGLFSYYFLCVMLAFFEILLRTEGTRHELFHSTWCSITLRREETIFSVEFFGTIIQTDL